MKMMKRQTIRNMKRQTLQFLLIQPLLRNRGSLSFHSAIGDDDFESNFSVSSLNTSNNSIGSDLSLLREDKNNGIEDLPLPGYLPFRERLENEKNRHQLDNQDQFQNASSRNDNQNSTSVHLEQQYKSQIQVTIFNSNEFKEALDRLKARKNEWINIKNFIFAKFDPRYAAFMTALTITISSSQSTEFTLKIIAT